MSHEIWAPNDDERMLGAEGYIHYASGIAILNNPERLTPLHAVEVLEKNLPDIANIAVKLMLKGSTDVIRFANPGEDRTRLSILESRYTDALPHMRAAIDFAYDSESERLDILNPFLRAVRPSGVLQRVIYGHICHSRTHIISTLKLMDGFQPSPIFKNIL